VYGRFFLAHDSQPLFFVLINFSSRRETSFSTTDASLKLGRIQLLFTLMLRVAEVGLFRAKQPTICNYRTISYLFHYLILHFSGDNDPLDVCEIGARIIPCGVSLYGF
jgi:inorganic pyrophosphatase